MRKNLGTKNCELGEEDIARICQTFLEFKESAQSKIFANADFGYWKVTVERPLRIEGADPNRAYKAAEIKRLREQSERTRAKRESVSPRVERESVPRSDSPGGENAPPIIRKIHKRGVEPDPLRGLFETTIDGRPAVVEYEPDSELRDSEQIPLTEEGGIDAFLEREVLPYAADAWYRPEKVKIGYEISFTRYFYKPQPLRSLEEIRAEILALERETEGLLGDIMRTEV